MLSASRRLSTLLHSGFIIVALSLPALVAAQVEDITPPTITMPVTGNYTTSTVAITIQFADSSIMDPNSLVTTLNGVAVTPPFSFVPHHNCPQTICGWSAISNGTLHLTAGSNTFHVELCDGEANCGSKDAHYTYSPPPPLQLLTVTPTYELIEAERGFSYNNVFTIYNGSSVSNTYTITRTCTAAVIASGCTPGTSSKTIAAGQSDTAIVSYVATSTAGATGTVMLRAVLSTDATVRDSGMFDVHVATVAAPGIVVANVNPGESVERGLCLTISLHSGAYECGDLRLDYAFPSVHTMEKDRAPTLIYSNQSAHPIERVAAEITLPNDGRIPDSVTAKLLVTRAGTPVQVDAEKWLGNDWTAGSTRHVTLSYDAISDSTGLYQYTIQVGRWYGATLESNSVASDLVVVNRSTSPFGAGWWVAGLERIMPLSGSAWLWIGGDGSTRVFAKNNINLWVAGNVDRRERLEFDGTYYCRRLPHHACVLFNSQGQHVQTRNRLGEVLATLDRTNFIYNGSLLTSIQLPVPSGSLSYTFSYDTVSGKPRFLKITAPPMGTVARVTTATITAGQLLSLKYNTHPAIQFAYDGSFTNRILSVTNQRGAVEKYTFGALNTVATAKLGPTTVATDSIRYTFTPAEIRGIGGTGNHAVTHRSTTTKYDGPRTDVGDTTIFWLDRFGAPTHIRDALGNETVMTRADPNYPALVTQLRLANGRTSTATYDTVGHVLTSTVINPLGTGVDATTTYTWNMKFDFIATTASPTGLLNTFGYDTLTGNRIWQYPGADPIRKVLFQYGNTLLQLSSTQLPTYSSTVRDSVLYGTLGNVVATRSPRGFVDSLYENSIGQDTLTVSPIGRVTTDTSRVRTRTVYDDRGLDTLSVANGSGQEWRTVRTHHDENGNTDSVSTSITPDIDTVGVNWHGFAFDSADRKTLEKLPYNETHTWVYDPAGNVLNGGARSGSGVANVYNALNQLAKRLSSDTAIFVYDEVGEMTNANNAAAQIARSYYPGGALKSDTLRTATTYLPDKDYSHHVYGLQYGYDLEGRRSWMKHPTLIDIAGDSSGYSYETISGQLSLIRDQDGNRFTFSYDTVGRLTKQVARSGQADSTLTATGYDSESNRTSYRGITATYDARGKMYSDSLVYSPLGSLRYFSDGNLIESYEVDALGNNFRTDVSGPDIPPSQPKFAHYAPGTSQLLKMSWRNDAGSHTDSTIYWYNPQTGVQTEIDAMKAADSIPGDGRIEHHTTYNYYDKQAQLDSTRTIVDTIGLQHQIIGTNYQSTEQYRYDALNRRIWVRNIRGADCIHKEKSSGCRSNLRRTVWDGDQILYEIQVLGDSNSAFLESDTYKVAPYYGTIAYVHGIGIDAPLALYKDNASTMVTPEQDMSGKFVDGECHPSMCGALQIYWPEASGSQYSILGLQPNGPPSWYGSIIEAQQDASGLQYKRNRYYDPQSGKFTQEDPIGLGGGLNTYGFANGDPVNFSDPLGLCPCNGDDFARQVGGLLTPIQRPLEVAGVIATLPLMATGEGAIVTLGIAGRAATGTATFFRGVSAAEAADVAANGGTLRAGAQAAGNEGKYLTNSAEAAAQWGARMNGEGSQVLRITVPADATKSFQVLNNGAKVDGIGQAFWAPLHALKEAVTEVMSAAPASVQ